MVQHVISSVTADSTETIEVAAHPLGPLRGLAMRRAFSSTTVQIQSACRRLIIQRRYPTLISLNLPHSLQHTTPITLHRSSGSPMLPNSPESIVVFKPATIRTPTPPIKFMGPEHTLVHLTIELKSIKRETSGFERRISGFTAELEHHKSYIQKQQERVDELEISIKTDHIPVLLFKRLEEDLAEKNRGLESVIAHEAAGKGQLLQLRGKVRQQARVQAQLHQKRNALENHSPLEAERFLQESVERARQLVAAVERAGDSRNAVWHPLRDTTSNSLIKLNRTKRSPYAPKVVIPKVQPPKLPIPHPTINETDRDQSNLEQEHISGAPSAFHPLLSTEGVTLKSSSSVKRHSLPVPDSFTPKVREEVEARLTEFYTPRSVTVRILAEQARISQSTPPSATLFESFDVLPQQVTSGIDILGNPPALNTPSTLKKASRRASSGLLGERLPTSILHLHGPRFSRKSVSATSLSTPPMETSPKSYNTPPSAWLPLSSPYLSSVPTLSFRDRNTDASLPAWAADVLKPLQNPRLDGLLSPSRPTTPVSLNLDLTIPTYAPNSTTPPHERAEWDVIDTASFEQRSSFQLTTLDGILTPSPERNIGGTRSAKLRKRASHILPRPPPMESSPVVEPGVAAKWRKRMSLTNVLHHHRPSFGGDELGNGERRVKKSSVLSSLLSG